MGDAKKMETALEAWDRTIEAEEAAEKEEVVEEVEEKEPGQGSEAETPETDTEKKEEEGEQKEVTDGAEGGQPEGGDGDANAKPQAPQVIEADIRWRNQDVKLKLTPDEHKALLQKGYDYDANMKGFDEKVTARTTENLGNWAYKNGFIEPTADGKWVPSLAGVLKHAERIAGSRESLLKTLGVDTPGKQEADRWTEEEKSLDQNDPVDANRLKEIQDNRTLLNRLAALEKSHKDSLAPLQERFTKMDESATEAQRADAVKSLDDHMTATLAKNPLLKVTPFARKTLGWEANDIWEKSGRTLSPQAAIEKAVANAVAEKKAEIASANADANKVQNQRPKPKTSPPSTHGGAKGAAPSKADQAKERFKNRGTPKGTQDAIAAFEALEADG